MGRQAAVFVFSGIGLPFADAPQTGPCQMYRPSGSVVLGFRRVFVDVDIAGSGCHAEALRHPIQSGMHGVFRIGPLTDDHRTYYNRPWRDRWDAAGCRSGTV